MVCIFPHLLCLNRFEPRLLNRFLFMRNHQFYHYALAVTVASKDELNHSYALYFTFGVAFALLALQIIVTL